MHSTARLTQQLERKARLERELAKEKERLIAMQYEVESMQRDLDARLRAPSSRPKVQKLRQEILTLQAECNRMTSEVDLTSPKQLPLGETNEEFYKHIYTGQLLTRSRQRLEGGGYSRHNPSAAASSGVAVGLGGGDGPNWTCHVCTFRNHPLLDKCEQCEMPRIVPDSTAETALADLEDMGWEIVPKTCNSTDNTHEDFQIVNVPAKELSEEL